MVDVPKWIDQQLTKMTAGKSFEDIGMNDISGIVDFITKVTGGKVSKTTFRSVDYKDIEITSLKETIVAQAAEIRELQETVDSAIAEASMMSALRDDHFRRLDKELNIKTEEIERLKKKLKRAQKSR